MPDNWHIVYMIYMHLHVEALPRGLLQWYNICIVLQIDQCKYSIAVFNNIHTL